MRLAMRTFVGGIGKDNLVAQQHRTRREEYAALTRHALVKAGAERFSDFGYAGTSIAQIADDARVSKGAFYHHFQDKSSLLKAVLSDACDSAALKIERTLENQVGSDSLVSGALDSAMESIQVDGRYRNLRQQAVGVLSAGERRELDNRVRVPLVSKIFTLLEEQGKIGDDVSVNAATVLVVAMLEATLDEMTASDDPQRCYAEYRPILLRFIESLAE